MDAEDLAIRFVGYDLISGIARTVSNALNDVVDAGTDTGNKLANAFTGAGLSLMGVGAVFATLATVLSFAFLSAASHAGDFESELVLLHTQAGLATNRVDELRNAILDMAPSKFSPQDIAHALFQVASLATYAGHEITIENAAIKLAAIGHSDLEKTTAVLSTTMLAFGANANEAATYAGILNGIVGSGRMRMDELNSALSTGLISAAQAAGSNFTSLGATLATLTDFNIPAAQAATSLRFAYASIQGPTKAAQADLQALGLTMSDVSSYSADVSSALRQAGVSHSQLADDMRSGGMIQVLEDLRTHMVALGISASDQETIVEKAFGGQRSGKGMVTLYEHLDQLQLKTAQVSARSTQLGNDFDYMISHDPAYALATLHTEVGKLVVIFGEAFVPVMMMIVPAAIKIIMTIEQWVRTHESLIASVGILAVKILAVVGAAFMVVGAIAIAIGWAIAFGSAIIGGIGGAIGVIMGAGGVLVTIFTTIGPLISFIIDMVIFFGGQIALAITNFALVGEMILDIAAAIGLASGVGIVLVVILAGAALIIASHWKEIVGVFERVGPAIATVFRQLQQGQSPLLIITTFLHNMGLSWEQVGTVMSVAHRIWVAIIAIVGQIVSQFQILIKSITSNKDMMDALNQGWSALMKVLPIIGVVIGVIAAIIAALLSGAFYGLMAALSHFIPGAVMIVVGVFRIFSGVIRTVADVAMGIWTLLVDVFTGHSERLGKDLNAIWNKLKDDLRDILEGLGNVLEGIWEATGATIIAFVGGFVQHFVGFFYWLYDQLVGHSIIPDLINAIVNEVGRLESDVLGFILGWIGRVTNAFTALAAGMVQIGRDIVNGLVNGLTLGWTTLTSTITTLAHQLPKPLQDFLGISSPSRFMAQFVGQPISEGMAQGVIEKRSLVTDAIMNLFPSVHQMQFAGAGVAGVGASSLPSPSFTGTTSGAAGVASTDWASAMTLWKRISEDLRSLREQGIPISQSIDRTLKHIDEDTPSIDANSSSRRMG